MSSRPVPQHQPLSLPCASKRCQLCGSQAHIWKLLWPPIQPTPVCLPLADPVTGQWSSASPGLTSGAAADPAGAHHQLRRSLSSRCREAAMASAATHTNTWPAWLSAPASPCWRQHRRAAGTSPSDAASPPGTTPKPPSKFLQAATKRAAAGTSSASSRPRSAQQFRAMYENLQAFSTG